ncbi:MAG: FAD-dependent oxidoreductase, partial [Akkermansiaceae bacterium]|nr:FAD-dependent oxidoreductase [Armatimonadota bacterium]
KPWDPPEERLYPVLDDLLADWSASFRPPWEGIRVLGNRWSPPSHAVKDFLARNQVPYQWLDIEAKTTDVEVRRLVGTLGDAADHLPVVLFPDGTNLTEPTNAQIAEKVGLTTQAKLPFYDLVVVGAGPAGLAAAVYSASEGLSTVMIEREAPGGQAGTSSRIENYLGFPSGLSGSDLARRAVDQAKRFGVEILAPQEVVKVRVENPYRILTLASGGEVSCHALLIATGVSWRRLDIPGLDHLTGAGVYYGAAVTEALSCRDEDVYVVGGANSAGQAAMYLSRFAGKVTMLVRGDSLRKSMSDYLVDQIERTENIEVRLSTTVAAAQGETRLECIVLENSESAARETVPASSLFILIGATPHTDWLEGVIARDELGFLLSGAELPHDEKTGRVRDWPLERDPYLLESSVPGIFVAGDVRRGSVKRIASGVGEGGVAVSAIHQYLSKV